MLHDNVTARIIGASIAVHRALGPGLKEQSYQAALAIELTEMNLQFQREPVLEVSYRGAVVGHHVPDFIVENAVVVELKAAKAIEPVAITQVLTYLRLANLRVGLIVNFNVEALKFGVKRIVN